MSLHNLFAEIGDFPRVFFNPYFPLKQVLIMSGFFCPLESGLLRCFVTSVLRQ